MVKESVESSGAFQLALLKSEQLRIFILLAAVGAAFFVRSLRTAIHPSRENFHLWILTALVIAVFVAYEFFVLRAVNRGVREGNYLGGGIWICNIIIETSLPAFAIALLSGGIAPAYRPLVNPAVLVFFIFIILSTLRLNPALCRLCGLVAALGYLIAAVYLGWKPSLGGEASLLSPERIVFAYAITLLVAGFVAGEVAREIRKHVEAALREAELQRQVERLEHDLEVARSIQQSLLPTEMPQLEGFDIAGWNQPADQTGGDYFDFYALPDGRVMAVLADVTGHGIGPALLAAVCRAYERANFFAGNDLYPAMERINSLISRDLQEGRFVTFVVAVCSPRNSRIELLSAGHGPLFMYFPKDDRFDKTDAQGLPLGISPTLVSDPPLQLEFHSGDLLVLATDGFYEWANAQGEMFGTDRMEDTIRKSRDKRASEIISAMYKAVSEFSGGTKQQDDLTAVIIKRR
ncbi:MAG TPA: PP2C family protein-serine/threonine phosphatase [Candidatus Acidoferrum sp.]|nr:PP2C family protein-serine/threonine phosphatase [Candidatus Acidoferrum sp.]